MPISEINNYLLNDKPKQFSNKTFSDFRQELLQYANTFYKDQIVDFSEASLGGLLLDFAAIVGDSLVYYAEQQFAELDYETATDIENIQKHLNRANIKKYNADPSSVSCIFTIEVTRDTQSLDSDPKPKFDHLPTIKKGTNIISESGVNFILQEDIDFSSGYKQSIAEENEDGSAFSLFLSKSGLCVSGEIIEEELDFDVRESGYFLSKELSNEGVTSVISVFDEDGNEFYEVDFLTQTTVFKKSISDGQSFISIIPAARRFIIENSFISGKTILRFGNGEGKDVRDKVFSNPDDLLLPLKNKDNFSRISLDPSNLLKNNAFGISPRGKILTVRYKSGGGISHNVPANSINRINGNPIVMFQNSNEAFLGEEIKNNIIESLSVKNEQPSIGGAEALTLSELKAKIPAAIRSQSRIITHEDLITRILTMPSDFGKINKATVLDNPYNTNTKDLYVLCKDTNNFYISANDAIKHNISKYLNEYRVIGDNFNILDIPVFNFGIRVKVRSDASKEISVLISDIQTRIVTNLNFHLLEVGDPINVNDIHTIIQTTEGVVSVVTDKKSMVYSKNNEDAFFDVEDLVMRTYNDNTFNPQLLYTDGFIYPPRSGIFEMRYTLKDILIEVN